MARTVTALTDPKCEAATPRDKEYKLFDGQGLYLAVKPSGVKTWRFKFTRPDGRAGLATLGNYPTHGLKAARGRRAAALELLTESTPSSTSSKHGGRQLHEFAAPHDEPQLSLEQAMETWR